VCRETTSPRGLREEDSNTTKKGSPRLDPGGKVPTRKSKIDLPGGPKGGKGDGAREGDLPRGVCYITFNNFPEGIARSS